MSFERPPRLTGDTDKITLTNAQGEKKNIYVTVNKADQKIREIFVISGKAGEETNSDCEAIGRLVSLSLQHGIPSEKIITTLRGIDGGFIGTYKEARVRSKAEIIALALAHEPH